MADHRFFKHMGREEESTTLNYLVSPHLEHITSVSSTLTNRLFQIELIDRVDDIYRNTSWDNEFTGYGVQIQQVRHVMDKRLRQ